MKPGQSTGKTNWEKLRAKRKAAPAPSEKDKQAAREFWADADVIIPDGKTRMTVRFDTDIVEWVRNRGPRYQTRMTAVLRQFVSSQKSQTIGDQLQKGGKGQRTDILDAPTTSMLPDQGRVEYLRALNQLGNICMNNGDYKNASKHFQNAVNLYQRETESYLTK